MLHYFVLLACSFGTASYAQPRVIPENMHERVIAVVPMMGTGTYADPKRPLFAPAPAEMGKPGVIQSFSWQPTDDGAMAIVEFVAIDRDALKAVLTDRRAVKVFEKGKDKREDIERELKIYRKDFQLDKTKRGVKP
ncbi:MAG: hypothetical protein WKF37_11785 [Bryobacteraceae bacterium]